MSKAYAEILRICFPSCFWNIGPQRAKIGPNGQTHDNRPRRSNKNIFSLDFKHWVLIFHKKFEFLFPRMNLGSFGVKIGSNLAPKGQKFTKSSREPNETIFPHNFKYLLWFLHKNCQFWFLGAYLGLFWGKIGSNLTLKGQKCTKRTREPNETIFSHSWKHWVLFLYKNFQFWFLGAYLGLFLVKISPKGQKINL